MPMDEASHIIYMQAARLCSLESQEQPERRLVEEPGRWHRDTKSSSLAHPHVREPFQVHAHVTETHSLMSTLLDERRCQSISAIYSSTSAERTRIALTFYQAAASISLGDLESTNERSR